MARKKEEGFVENGGGEFPYDHVLGREEVAGIASIQGNAPFGSTLGSGEREAVSIFFTIAITPAGLLFTSPVSTFRSADMC